jgi:isopentenyl-diphosphate delta-isomerase
MLILVDESDRVVGHLPKGPCHDGKGVLHRAFSLFVYDDAGRLLLQQRSGDKRLWPLFWSNSCCSHPRRGETMDEAIHRRLLEELGLESDLEYLFKFQYEARYGELGSENEICWVYAGRAVGPVRANPLEVASHRWVSPDELDDEIAEDPENFTPWFLMEWPRVRESLASSVDF